MRWGLSQERIVVYVRASRVLLGVLDRCKVNVHESVSGVRLLSEWLARALDCLAPLSRSGTIRNIRK